MTTEQAIMQLLDEHSGALKIYDLHQELIKLKETGFKYDRAIETAVKTMPSYAIFYYEGGGLVYRRRNGA